MESAFPSSSRILLVEPDPLLQSVLAEMLSQEGYEVSVTRSLEEVSAQLAEETFALVLADVYAGRASAGSFAPAHRLRRLVHPAPVGLLMTLPFAPEEARHAGFAFVLPMPFELEDALTQVAAALQPSLNAKHEQQIQMVERYFAAREREDWQAVLDLCTKDVTLAPLGFSRVSVPRWMKGHAALRDYLASIAQSALGHTFLHFYYAPLPKGLFVQYVGLWNTSEGERRRTAKVAIFHFRGTQICQIGTRPLLTQVWALTQTG